MRAVRGARVVARRVVERRGDLVRREWRRWRM